MAITFPLHEYPTRDQWSKIAKTYPFERIMTARLDFETVGSEWSVFFENMITAEWQHHLNQSAWDVMRSYVMLIFYFELGIPDDEWMISPGKDDCSVEYFPHFTEKHFAIKDSFDYYADVLFYKLFAAWDILWQVLNVRLGLNLTENQMKTGSFFSSIKEKYPALWKDLRELCKDRRYTRAQELRNTITHSYHPAVLSRSVHREGGKITFGVGSYIPSKEIVNAVRDALDVFAESLDLLKNIGVKPKAGSAGTHGIRTSSRTT